MSHRDRIFRGRGREEPIPRRKVFLVEYDCERARVLVRPSTETRFGPRGAMCGKRAEGVLGRGPATFTLVSVNELRLEDEKSMMLVTEETYRMVPRKEGGRSGR